MRINNSGTYEYCRWRSIKNHNRFDPELNIRQMLPSEYFNLRMAPIRQQLLDGKSVNTCATCYEQDQHGKVSGRQRQLLKVGVRVEHFESALASSTFRPAFDYSYNNNGLTTTQVQDWQIDLGNYCNSQCVMCGPASSSRLATEFKTLGLINELPPRAWCDDPELIEKFCNDLSQARHIQYLHFIGGETLITPGFRQILSALVEHNLAADVTIGFTTNLTVWDDSIVDLLSKFKQVQLGLSVETLTPVNDYIRYPSQLATTIKLLDQWVELARQLNWLTQLRITPTCLSIGDLTTVYDYALQHNLSVESCNFLEHPEYLRISVLPPSVRKTLADKIKLWIGDRSTGGTAIINTRDPNVAVQQIVQDAESYVAYLSTAPDESNLLPDLVNYLKLLESSRGNSILTYLPEYEQLLRSHGY
jgi:hypothetical protein